jgi:5'-nucleotidase
MRKLGDVTVLAPERNWSAAGHVKTMHRPLRVRKIKLPDGTNAFTSDGAPSDCVALALLGYVDRPVNLVVSGINPHANIGHDVTYSGTVTAAMEAVIRGVPGIAISVDSPENHMGDLEYAPAASLGRKIATEFIHNGFPNKTVLNINVPYMDEEQIKGIQITRQGMRVYHEQLDGRIDPRGLDYYWIGGKSPGGVSEEKTEYGAIKAGYVSITPLQLDLTAYHTMESLQRINWD